MDNPALKPREAPQKTSRTTLGIRALTKLWPAQSTTIAELAGCRGGAGWKTCKLPGVYRFSCIALEWIKCVHKSSAVARSGQALMGRGNARFRNG